MFLVTDSADGPTKLKQLLYLNTSSDPVRTPPTISTCVKLQIEAWRLVSSFDYSDLNLEKVASN